MSPNLKSEKHKVVSTGKIDGGAYRAVETPDGGAMVEEWKDGAWVPGGAGYGEVREAPPVSPGFAASLGIPIEDLQEAIYQTTTSARPHLVMIDSPGPFSPVEEWERHLTEVEALPLDTLNRNQLIDEAKRTIARKRQEVEKPSEVSSTDKALILANRNKNAAGFKPDYGLRLLNDGFSRTADLFFYEFRLYSISVLGNGAYSTMVEQRYDGELYALSLDFNHAQLEQILVGADPTLAAFIRTQKPIPPDNRTGWVRERCRQGAPRFVADRRK
jgi:hypothetical protein